MFAHLSRLRRRFRNSPSKDWEDFGRLLAADMTRGFEQAGARRAELLASGMTPEEAQVVMLRETVLNADPVMLAYSEGVVRRSFPTLYEDDGDELEVRVQVPSGALIQRHVGFTHRYSIPCRGG